jgi:hypothetical protein
MRYVCIAVLGVLLMASCDRKDRITSLAESDVKEHTECQGKPEILGVSEPDSAFGTGYLSQKEKEGRRRHFVRKCLLPFKSRVIDHAGQQWYNDKTNRSLSENRDLASRFHCYDEEKP